MVFPIIFFLFGCNDGIIDGSQPEDQKTVIKPKVSIEEPNVVVSNRFSAESAYFGLTDFFSDTFEGVIKVKYLGSADLNYLDINVQMIDKNNKEIENYNTLFHNEALCYLIDGGYSHNNDNYVTPTNNVGYILFRGSLSSWGIKSLSNIAKIRLLIYSHTFSYAPPQGRISRNGQPYIDKNNCWCINGINDGDKKIRMLSDNALFLYTDSENRLYRWDASSEISGGKEKNYIDVGETAIIKGGSPYKFNPMEKFNCSKVVFFWQ